MAGKHDAKSASHKKQGTVIIEEMTGQEIKSLLQRATVGRLACSKEGQPYVVPLSFTYDVVYLYSLTTAGKR